jgi:hypothetical protein
VPSASRVRGQAASSAYLDVVLGGIVRLDAGLGILFDMAPGDGKDAADDGEDEVDEEGEELGDDELGGGQKSQGLDGIAVLDAVRGRVRLVTEKVEVRCSAGSGSFRSKPVDTDIAASMTYPRL